MLYDCGRGGLERLHTDSERTLLRCIRTSYHRLINTPFKSPMAVTEYASTSTSSHRPLLLDLTYLSFLEYFRVVDYGWWKVTDSFLFWRRKRLAVFCHRNSRNPPISRCCRFTSFLLSQANWSRLPHPHGCTKTRHRCSGFTKHSHIESHIQLLNITPSPHPSYSVGTPTPSPASHSTRCEICMYVHMRAASLVRQRTKDVKCGGVRPWPWPSTYT